VEEIGITLRNRSKYYIDKYGVVPKFRAGVHGCETVSRSVGSERKMEIVYFGDTINTVARLTALSRELGVEVLVSENMVKCMKNPPAKLTALGEFQLKGLQTPLSV
jgi:adenylate cyclase